MVPETLCRFPGCARMARFHVLLVDRAERHFSNLCNIHTADALRDGAHSAHRLAMECFDSMYYPELSKWLDNDNRCGIPTTPHDPFNGWRLQDA